MNIINYFYDKINKQSFEPCFWGIFVNPFYIARKELVKNITSLANEICGITLDIGCGKKPYRKFFDTKNYFGLDLPSSIHNVRLSADLLYDGKYLPIKTNSIDSVVSNQVFEHIFEPEKFLSELQRILKVNGKLLITLPFVWDEHEKPIDFARYTSFGIKYLLTKYGFEIISHQKTANNISILAQLLNLYIYKIVYKNLLIKRIATLIIMAPITIMGLFLGKIFPKNDDLFLDNVILAVKKQNLHLFNYR